MARIGWNFPAAQQNQIKQENRAIIPALLIPQLVSSEAAAASAWLALYWRIGSTGIVQHGRLADTYLYNLIPFILLAFAFKWRNNQPIT